MANATTLRTRGDIDAARTAYIGAKRAEIIALTAKQMIGLENGYVVVAMWNTYEPRKLRFGVQLITLDTTRINTERAGHELGEVVMTIAVVGRG